MRTAYVRWQAVLEAFRSPRPTAPEPPAPLPSREPSQRTGAAARNRERDGA